MSGSIEDYYDTPKNEQEKLADGLRKVVCPKCRARKVIHEKYPEPVVRCSFCNALIETKEAKYEYPQ